MIIDHTCTDLSRVPDSWINTAKENLRVGYGHTSHGSQPVSGIMASSGNQTAVQSSGGHIFSYRTIPFTYSGWGLERGVFLNDLWGNAGGADDLGCCGETSWRDATEDMLAMSGNDRNVVIWSWCGGVSYSSLGDIDVYLSTMNELENTYPNVTFVYMTGHLDGSGTGGQLHQGNERIRAFCRDNNKVLFDFADIESYDPDGNYYLDRGADDGCNYDGGNWANEWLDANPGHELAALAGACESCAHSHNLNCALKGRAFWWMMARIAGWED